LGLPHRRSRITPKPRQRDAERLHELDPVMPAVVVEQDRWQGLLLDNQIELASALRVEYNRTRSREDSFRAYDWAAAFRRRWSC